MIDNISFDVIIIGGSYAGLSAAMSLGRSMRKVLIIDSGKPCNRSTPHSHNFITQDGEKPAAIAQKAKDQVLKYDTVKWMDAAAARGVKTAHGFEITTQAGDNFSAGKLVIATGINDEMPHIKGFEACWGISVIHCPYCHGYEFRGKNTGIMANGERAFHLASLVNNLTDNITLFTSGKADLSDEQISKLATHNIKITTTEIGSIEHDAGRIKKIFLVDGSTVDVDALYASIPFTQQSNIPASLGCEITTEGHIKVDDFQQTTVEGVFACGDNSSLMRSVANAVHRGNLAGAMVNKALTDEQF